MSETDVIGLMVCNLKFEDNYLVKDKSPDLIKDLPLYINAVKDVKDIGKFPFRKYLLINVENDIHVFEYGHIDENAEYKYGVLTNKAFIN